MSVLDSVSTYSVKYFLNKDTTPSDWRFHIPSRTIRWPVFYDDSPNNNSLEEVLLKCTNELEAEAARQFLCGLFELPNLEKNSHTASDPDRLQLIKALQRLSEDIGCLVSNIAVTETLAELLIDTNYHRCDVTATIRRSEVQDDGGPNRLKVLWTFQQCGSGDPGEYDLDDIQWETAAKFVMSKENGEITFDMEIDEKVQGLGVLTRNGRPT